MVAGDVQVWRRRHVDSIGNMPVFTYECDGRRVTFYEPEHAAIPIWKHLCGDVEDTIAVSRAFDLAMSRADEFEDGVPGATRVLRVNQPIW